MKYNLYMEDDEDLFIFCAAAPIVKESFKKYPESKIIGLNFRGRSISAKKNKSGSVSIWVYKE